MEQKDFIYNKTANNPLQPVTSDYIIKSIINPLTKKPYEGIILFGDFISFNVLNNNNRFYEADNYLEYLKILKQTANSSKGLYGELEHPKDYPINYNNISHKILDFWYEPAQNKVVGYVLLLDTPKGKIAQEVIKSGGQLGISARGGGSEVDQPDGTKKAIIKLLITFDLVNHPGFSDAIMGFNSKTNNFQTLNESFFYTPNNFTKLFENQNQQEELTPQKQQRLQNSEAADQDKVQEKLQKAVDTELKECNSEFEEDKKIQQIFESINKNNFRKHMNQRNIGLEKIKKFNNL
jgi:prohead core scaffold and protease|nr:MAG TPA: Prohead core protein serine protease [Caudoviricetes sp.]